MNLIESFVFLFGICVGSFLNVCIHRMPREESVAKGRSRCVECGQTIAWYDNIPLVSYLVLRGRCRHCHKPFSFRYFAVELLTGLTWVYLWRLFGGHAESAVAIFLFSNLIAVTFTDFETGYIPDALSLSGMIMGLAFSGYFPQMHGETLWYKGLLHSALGLLVGGGILMVLGMIGDLLFKKESMGGGDIKLLAMLGAFLGIQKVVLVFFMAPVLSMPFALYVKFIKKTETIPYGPFIAAAGAWTFLNGSKFLETYIYF